MSGWESMSGDELTRRLERLARAADRSHKKGLCTHGWGRSRPTHQALDAEQAAIPVGGFLCYHCGQTFDREADADQERRDRLREAMD